MESPAKLSGGETTQIPDARRSGPKPGRQVAAAALEVADVVRHGMGRGSRIDLTIVTAGHRVRLTGLPAKHCCELCRSAVADLLQIRSNPSKEIQPVGVSVWDSPRSKLNSAQDSLTLSTSCLRLPRKTHVPDARRFNFLETRNGSAVFS